MDIMSSCLQVCLCHPLLFASSFPSACDSYGAVMQYDIVSGLPAVQRLRGTSRTVQQGSPPEILNVHRMCQAGSRKAFQ